jgi:hypothetical protein
MGQAWQNPELDGESSSSTDGGISVCEHAGFYMPPVLVWAGAVSGSGWTHVAVVLNNGVPSLYVNGIFRRTGLKGGHANVVPTFVIGSSIYGNCSLGVDE